MTFDAAGAAQHLVTTPDELGPCQQYCEALKTEVRRLRQAIQTALDSPCVMGGEDIDVLVAALAPPPKSTNGWSWPRLTCPRCGRRYPYADPAERDGSPCFDCKHTEVAP